MGIGGERGKRHRDLGGLEALFAGCAGTPRLENALDRHGTRAQELGILLRRQLNVHERSLLAPATVTTRNSDTSICFNSARAPRAASPPTSSPSTPSRAQVISAPDRPRISSSALSSLSRKLSASTHTRQPAAPSAAPRPHALRVFGTRRTHAHTRSHTREHRQAAGRARRACPGRPPGPRHCTWQQLPAAPRT